MTQKDLILTWTGIRQYFWIEINLFLSQVYFGVIFIFMAKLFKMKSFWNKNKMSFIDDNGVKVLDDIWSDQKVNSDFLRHLKFEFLQYGLGGSFLFNSILSNFRYSDWMPLNFDPEYISKDVNMDSGELNKAVD